MIRTLVIAAVAALSLASFQAHAEEGTTPSYAAKKQGRVVFQSDKTEETVEGAQATETTAPEAIEPAAGASDDAAPAKAENPLKDELKLPRKN